MAVRKTNVKWQMQESSQRGLCRAVFVLFGVCPLLLAIAFSIAQLIPAYQEQRARAWSTWLSGRLGVDVQVAAVESLTPERFVLHGLRLSHPESRASLGRIRSVAVSHQASVWSIRLDQPEFETRQLSATWKMMHDWFVCRPQTTQPGIRIECDDLRLRDLDQTQSLEQIAVEIYSRSERTVVGAKFRMPNAEPNSQPSVLRIIRQHSDRHLSTALELDSGLAGLPCKLISPVLPFVQQLGDQAVFQGKLTLFQRNSAWEANITEAWLVGIDFGRLTADLNSHITGEGYIRCENVKVNHRGLLNAYGKATIQHGRIDSKILNACHQSLDVALPRAVYSASVELHSFEQLQAIIEIAPGTFRLAGGIQESLPDFSGRTHPLSTGTLIADAAGEIAIRSNFDRMPLQNLVAAIGYDQGIATASANSQNAGGWLAQRAAWWLPLEIPQKLSRVDANEDPQLR